MAPSLSLLVNASCIRPRSSFVMRDLDSEEAASASVAAAAVPSSRLRLDCCGCLPEPTDGRKKGAFSGALGASVGLLRCLMRSRWRSVCQRLLGTSDSVVSSALSWSTVGATTVSSSPSASSSLKAASSMPSPPSPDVVGPVSSAASLSDTCRVGTCVKRDLLVQMATPSSFSIVAARYSPVDDMASAVHAFSSRMASMRWLNSLIVLFVSRSTTRIELSSHENAIRSLAAWYLQPVIAVIGAQLIWCTRLPVRKSQNLILPSREHVMTFLFIESTTMPVIAFVCLPVPGAKWLSLSVCSCTTLSACLSCCIFIALACAGVSLEGNRWRWRPDCRLYMSRPPSTEPTRANVPQGLMAIVETWEPSPVGNAHRPAFFRPQNHLLLGVAVLLPDGVVAGYGADAAVAVQGAGNARDLGGLQVFQSRRRAARESLGGQNARLLGHLADVSLAELGALAVTSHTPAPETAVLATTEQPLVTRIGTFEVGGQKLQALDGGGVSAALVQDTRDRREGTLVKDPRLQRVVASAGDNDGLARQELDLADTTPHQRAVSGWRVVRTAQNTHDPASVVEVPECNVSSCSGGGRHDTVFPAVMTGPHPVGSERDGRDGLIVVASLQQHDWLVGQDVLDDQGAVGVGDGQQRERSSRLHACDSATVGGRRENGVDELAGADVPDFDPAVLATDADLVEVGGHVRDTAGNLIGALLASHGVKRGVVLQGGRLPYFESRHGASYDPRPEDQDLLDGLVEVSGDLELLDLLSALESPDTLPLALPCVTPCCENLLFPCERRGDVGGRLGTGDEDEVEAPLQIVGLQSSSNRSRNLERRLSKGD
ncbi:hypothetical protein ColKHC_03023 [Colletotrichum higginsianum]|nr:hypothetical protein ColKHC_03023 [Colletotrichum higginsianum]